MNFRIADTFTDSLARLTNQEQAAAKQTAFDLQVNPAQPGLQFHRVDRARDKDFWTVRVNRDLRIVVHKRGGDVLLAYVDHHDDAYAWAERRRLDVHPATGAAQIVEIRETVREIVVPTYVTEEVRKPALLPGETDETLLACGVPPDWLDDVRGATEDTILEIAAHLPAEAAEAVLNLAIGIRPEPTAPAVDPYEHPDAQRRFRLTVDEEELRRALDAPWEKWTVFLHPAQREFVTRDFNGPARVTGSAGTGKTVVALHRAVRLARENPEARVLLTTYNEVLAASLRTKLSRLLDPDSDIAHRITIQDFATVARRLQERLLGPVDLARRQQVRDALVAAAEDSETSLPERFLDDEWTLVIDARNVRSLDDYIAADRRGRRVRMREIQRGELWAVFARVREIIAAAGAKTEAEMLFDLADRIASCDEKPFDFCVVDEAQDISEAQLAFLAAIAGDRPNGLFFAGDVGQRIFRPRFAWSAHGVEIRGRSRTLKVNYRTSHQIRWTCDVLLPQRITELDGAEEDRAGVTSVFEGPAPRIATFADLDGEKEEVAEWLAGLSESGIAPHEVAIAVRTVDQFPRAESAASCAGLTVHRLTGTAAPLSGKLNLLTMHVAKGLEFRAVAVMACDDQLMPLASRIEAAADETDLEEIFATERHLLYVACTRAREHLMVTAVEPVSEFLDDLVFETH